MRDRFGSRSAVVILIALTVAGARGSVSVRPATRVRSPSAPRAAGPTWVWRRRRSRSADGQAGLNPAEWTPRELRHSFVSLLSDHGMPLEKIADLVGHSGTTVTEEVYRHQLRRSC